MGFLCQQRKKKEKVEKSSEFNVGWVCFKIEQKRILNLLIIYIKYVFTKINLNLFHFQVFLKRIIHKQTDLVLLNYIVLYNF